MKKIYFFFTICGLAISASVNAQTVSSSIDVTGYGIHYGGQLVYRYQVINRSPSAIDSLQIGDDSTGQGFPSSSWITDTAHSDVPATVSLNRCKPFSYMRCQAVVYQFDFMQRPVTTVTFSSAELDLKPHPTTFTNSSQINGYSTSSTAEIMVPAADASYLNSRVTLKFIANFLKDKDGKAVTSLSLPITKIDRIGPTVSGTSNVSKSADKLNVKITVHASDDLDPEPEIKYVSVTSNQALHVGDVVVHGDGRAFTVQASKGRVYIFHYSATDGSGNVGTGSVVVKSP